MQMNACKTVWGLLAMVYCAHLASSKNKTQKEWAASFQKTIWEGSQVFHRTLIGMTHIDTKSETAPKYLKSLPKFSSKIAGTLGVIGALFSIALAFIPGVSQESSEMKYMKEEFGKLSQKIDSVAQSIDDVKDLIKLDTQKAAYIRDQNKIQYGAQQLNESLTRIGNVSCTDQQECKRKKLSIAQEYVTAMNVREHVENILQGTTNNAALSTSLLELLKEESDCNIPKMNRFINKIVSLLVQGMKTAIYHDLLTKQDYNYEKDVENLHKMLGTLEAARQTIEDSCFKSVNYYLGIDVRDSHSMFTTNTTRTNEILLYNIARKYPWINWQVITFGGNKQPVSKDNSSIYSSFLSSSKDKNIHAVVIPTLDRKVSKLHSKTNRWIKMIETTNFGEDPKAILEAIQQKADGELEFQNQIQSLAILPGSDVILGHYNNETLQQLQLKTTLTNTNLMISRPNFGSTNDFAVAVVFKSDEDIKCSESCSGNGTCYFFPYSNKMACRCKDGHNGERCEYSDSNFRHQFVIDSLFTATMKLPSFVSIQNTLEDTHLYLKTSFNNIQESIARLEAKIDEKFKVLGSFMSEKFDWFNVLIKYKDAIGKLDYFQSLSDRKIKETKWQISHKINVVTASKETSTEDREIARYLLGPVGIQNWLYQLNFLIMGRNDNEFNSHKPLLFLVMDKYKSRLCYPDYKAEIDKTFRQLMLLQLRGYILWTQAYSVLNQDSSPILQRYMMVLEEQKNYFEGATCSVGIPHSKNFRDCSGGYYIHPTMDLTVLCDDDHYLHTCSKITLFCFFF